MDFGFFGRFLTKKQPKQIWQNPNRLMKFSEIWYVDASQQKKCHKKTLFWISTFFGRFLTKNSQNRLKMKKNGKIQTV